MLLLTNIETEEILSFYHLGRNRAIRSRRTSRTGRCKGKENASILIQIEHISFLVLHYRSKHVLYLQQGQKGSGGEKGQRGQRGFKVTI